MPLLPGLEKKKVQTTNAIANVLDAVELRYFSTDTSSIDVLAALKAMPDWDQYEEKEKEIPKLIYDVLKRESQAFTRLVTRSYWEENGWLVRVECKEGEYLADHGHEITIDAFRPFVRIHVPRIFIRTLALPMIARNCC